MKDNEKRELRPRNSYPGTKKQPPRAGGVKSTGEEGSAPIKREVSDRGFPAGRPESTERRPLSGGDHAPSPAKDIGRQKGGDDRLPAGGTPHRVSDGPPRQRRVNPIEAARRKRERKIITYSAALVILLLAVAVALIARACGVRENTDDFRVYMPDKHVVAYDDIVRGGSLYLNAGALSEFCELTLSGSRGNLKLSSDKGEYASFTPGSQTTLINGVLVGMSAPAILDGGELWLPVDFISSCFAGIKITVDREGNKITVTRAEAAGSTSGKPVYVDVGFISSKGATVKPEDIRAMIASYTFKTDLVSYFAYLNPADPKYLLLVNKNNPLGESYKPEGLAILDKSLTLYGSEIKLEDYAKHALEAMMKEMRASGYGDIYISSGYRDYAYQSQLFNHYISKEMAENPALTLDQAKEIVMTYSAKPGTSEHQSGLCTDLISSSMSELDNSFANLSVYVWLTENAHKFGFVLRYPADKISVTGYAYESWHYRFVGQYHAAAMKVSGLCLEEYLPTLNT